MLHIHFWNEQCQLSWETRAFRNVGVITSLINISIEQSRSESDLNWFQRDAGFSLFCSEGKAKWWRTRPCVQFFCKCLSNGFNVYCYSDPRVITHMYKFRTIMSVAILEQRLMNAYGALMPSLLYSTEKENTLSKFFYLVLTISHSAKNIIDAFHLNSTGPFGTRIYFLTKLKYVTLWSK